MASIGRNILFSFIVFVFSSLVPQSVENIGTTIDPGGGATSNSTLNVNNQSSNNTSTDTTNSTGPAEVKLNALQNTCTTDDRLMCPSNHVCSKLGACCRECNLNVSCAYGANVTVQCEVTEFPCTGSKVFNVTFQCRYCYQTEEWEHDCTSQTYCSVHAAPRPMYTANCTVRDHIMCLGRRKFYKRRVCNWTSGYRWSTALILSITLGGFGADRFYLGLWREGIGKLFSLGGLGVWTIVDVILIAVGYITPYDGSLYIY